MTSGYQDLLNDNRGQCDDNCKDTGQHGKRATRAIGASILNCSTHIKSQATRWKDTLRDTQEGGEGITYGIPGQDYKQWFIGNKCKLLFRKISKNPRGLRIHQTNMGCFRQVVQCTEPMLNIAPSEPEEEQDMESSQKAPNPILLHLAISWPIWPALTMAAV